MPNDIFLLHTGDNQLKRLTISGTADFPAWSPAGRLLAYITQGVGPEEEDILYLQDVDGGCGYPLLQRDEIVHFAWSPDGQRLAFITQGSRVFQLDLAEELEGRWQDGMLICD
jgi:Tol biopolymer transport system component